MSRWIKRIVVWVGIILLLAIFGVPCLWFAHVARFSMQEARAKEMCQQLIPRLNQIKDQTGEFPRQLPATWLPSELPSVIDRQRLYESDGRNFTFHFYNRSSFWDDVWVLHSQGTNWATWDDNEWCIFDPNISGTRPWTNWMDRMRGQPTNAPYSSPAPQVQNR